MRLHSEGLNIISEGYLRMRFFLGGGVGVGRLTFGRACFRGGGGAYYMLWYSPVGTCVRFCHFVTSAITYKKTLRI